MGPFSISEPKVFGRRRPGYGDSTTVSTDFRAMSPFECRVLPLTRLDVYHFWQAQLLSPTKAQLDINLLSSLIDIG